MLRAARWVPWLFREAAGEEANCALDLRSVHGQHADFVWTSLQRLGVREADLPDVHQDVFLVVHRKLDTYDGRAPIRAWLFGICRCKAAAYRRSAFFRREETTDAIDEWTDEGEGSDLEANVEMRKARATLDAMLDRLDIDKRAVFVMFEIEGMACERIAETLGIPVGTVYSRLHLARKIIERAIERRAARSGEGGRS